MVWLGVGIVGGSGVGIVVSLVLLLLVDKGVRFGRRVIWLR